ncbi:MAG: FIST C-terminal domain-containing protein [Motiliproteus sp.]|nr:FIST C-terminal domain-containing protein [Motiliproteus sp.]MCW9054135.1 FIST C-terminal domain-containing protein [Motiliproteus sp.]
MTKQVLGTRQGYSKSGDAESAVIDLKTQIAQPEISLILVFCSLHYDIHALAQALQRAFPDTLVVGCSTAGEIGPKGYSSESITAISFSASEFSVSLQQFDDLQGLSLNHWRKTAAKGHSVHNTRYQLHDDSNTFALLLVDGMSVREEPLVRMIASAMPKVPLIGGSAGDDLAFKATYLFHQGELLEDAALLLMITTQLPFKVFKTQHFQATEQRMVVTEAVPEKRKVTEINGHPAALEYARLLGISSEQLSPLVFAAHPVVVRMGDAEFVRSIQKVNDDGSLTFFCAIDVGIVLRIACGVDMVSDLDQSMQRVREQLGQPQAVITCDCILRRLELQQESLMDPVSEILAEHRCIGFSTYGEQFNGVHVNQTCTGVAIGYPSD